MAIEFTCSELRAKAEEARRHAISSGFQFEPDPDKSKAENAKAEKEAAQAYEDRVAEADLLVEQADNREGCI